MRYACSTGSLVASARGTSSVERGRRSERDRADEPPLRRSSVGRLRHEERRLTTFGVPDREPPVRDPRAEQRMSGGDAVDHRPRVGPPDEIGVDTRCSESRVVARERRPGLGRAVPSPHARRSNRARDPSQSTVHIDLRARSCRAPTRRWSTRERDAVRSEPAPDRSPRCRVPRDRSSGTGSARRARRRTLAPSSAPRVQRSASRRLRVRAVPELRIARSSPAERRTLPTATRSTRARHCIRSEPLRTRPLRKRERGTVVEGAPPVDLCRFRRAHVPQRVRRC